MKEKKFKCIAAILGFVLLFQYISVLAPLLEVRAETATDENGISWTYTLSGENAINVAPSDKSKISGNVAIPATLEGHKVTGIGGYAFNDCSSLTSIEIPSSVTSIRDGAFRECSKLTSIEIPSSVTSIGDSAFEGCSKLTSIEIPSSVTSIGDSAFEGCSKLTSIEIPSSVTSIGDRVFMGCSSLTSIKIPSSVTSIESYAFNGCSSLTSIKIPSSVTSIGYYTFDGCNSLTSIEIPSSVTSIGAYAFKGCSKLTSINIPEGVTSLESGTFNGCNSLTSIEIPSSVTSIGAYAFEGCSKLTSINIPEGVASLESGTFNGCSSLTSIKIPSSVTSIGRYAFDGCSSLTSIKIPSSVTSIGYYAFDGCSSLKSITIPEGVTSIEWGAFSYYPPTIFVKRDSKAENALKNAGYNYTYLDRITCSDDNGVTWSFSSDSNNKAYRLKYESGTLGETIEIPSKLGEYEVKSIGNGGRVFGSMSSNITKVIIDKKIDNIEASAFNDCTNLKMVVFFGYTSLAEDVFKNCNEDLTLLCPVNSGIVKYATENNIKYETFSDIEFSDKNLYNKIKNQIEENTILKSDDQYNIITILQENIDKIINLDISNSKISDLTGIEYFRNLKELDASNNNINDVSKIVELGNLTKLNLSNNKLNNKEELIKLVNLEILNISNNEISDISNFDVSKMTKLNNLDLSYNKIRDISALENVNISNLNLKNQEISDVTYKEENELPNIIKKAKDSKYTNGESVAYETQNCEIVDDKVIVSNVPATIIIKNGLMNGTKYTIDLDNEISLDSHNLDGDKLTLIFSKNYSNVTDVDVYYSIDSEKNIKYNNGILLNNGTHNISVKLFNKELANFNVTVDLVINAIRKNGRIYILSNSYETKKYSLTGDDFVEYTEPIENTDAETIFVKIGENEAQEITIRDTGVNGEYEIYDAKTGVNDIDDTKKIIRKNGIVYLKFDTIRRYIQF